MIYMFYMLIFILKVKINEKYYYKRKSKQTS